MVNPNRLSDLIDRSNSNIDVIKDNFLVLKGLDENNFNKLLESFGDEKEHNKVMLSNFLNSKNITLMQLGDIKVNINNINSFVQNKPNFPKNIERKIAKLYLQKLYEKGQTINGFVEEFEMRFCPIQELENKKYDFKKIQSGTRGLSEDFFDSKESPVLKQFSDVIKETSISNDEIFSALNLNRIQEFKYQSISDQDIILNILEFEVRDLIRSVRDWGENAVKDMKKVIQPTSTVSEIFDKVKDPEIEKLVIQKGKLEELENLILTKDIYVDKINLKQYIKGCEKAGLDPELISKLKKLLLGAINEKKVREFYYYEMQKTKKKIWKKYIENFERNGVDSEFVSVMKKLVHNNFNFSQLSKSEQTILWHILVVNNIDVTLNERADLIDFDQEDFQKFMQNLYDFEKNDLTLKVAGVGDLNLKIKKEINTLPILSFSDVENFKDMSITKPIRFTVNIDDNDEEIIHDLESEGENGDNILRLNGLMETHMTKSGPINIGNGYELEICGKTITKKQFDALLDCDYDEVELNKKLKEVGLESLQDLVFSIKQEMFNSQNIFNNLDEDGFDDNSNSDYGYTPYGYKFCIFKEMLKKLDVKVKKRNLIFDGTNIDTLSQLYFLSKLAGDKTTEHIGNIQDKKAKNILGDYDRDGDEEGSEALGGEDEGNAKATQFRDDLKTNYQDNHSEDEDGTPIYSIGDDIAETLDGHWDTLNESGKDAFEAKLNELCDNDGDLEDDDKQTLRSVIGEYIDSLRNKTTDDEDTDEPESTETEEIDEEDSNKAFENAWNEIKGDSDLNFKHTLENDEDIVTTGFEEGTRLYFDLGESQLPPKDIGDSYKSYYCFEIVNVGDDKFTLRAIGGDLKSSLVGKEYEFDKTKESLDLLTKSGSVYKVKKGDSRAWKDCIESINKAGFFKKITSFGSMEGQVHLDGNKFVNEKGEEIKYFDRVEGYFDDTKPEVKDRGQGSRLYKYEIKKIDTTKGTVKITSSFNSYDDNYKEVKCNYENELPFEQFILLMEGKRLKGYTQEEQEEMEIKYNIDDPKRLATKGRRRWISIGSIMNVFGNTKKAIKGKIEENRKEQDEVLENYLFSQEGLNLYGRSRWLLGDTAEKLQYEFYTNRENRTWKKIDERYKIFETDPQYSEFFAEHLQHILGKKGYVGNDKDRYKFAAAFLIMVKKEGPYPRVFADQKDKGKRVENLLGPEHKTRFLNFYQKKKNELEQEKDMGHQSGARLALQEELNKMEIQYIISTIDGRAPYGPFSNEYMLKSIWSKTFMSKLEENINGYYNNHQAEKDKLETFYAAEESYLRNIGSGKFQAALPALERMCETAKTPGEVYRIKGYILGAMLMGIIKNNSTAKTIKSFWGTCRSMGFAPGFRMRDVEHPDKVKALLDGVTNGGFSKETKFNVSDFEPGNIKDGKYSFGRKFQSYWNSHGSDILKKIEDPKYKNGDSDKSIIDLANEKDNPNSYIFKDIINNSTTNEIDSTNDKVPPIFAQRSPLSATSNIVKLYIPENGKYSKLKNEEDISNAEDFWSEAEKAIPTDGNADQDTVDFIFKKYFNRFDTKINTNDQTSIVRSIKLIQREKEAGRRNTAEYMLWYMFKGKIHETTRGAFPKPEFENVMNNFVKFFYNNIEKINGSTIKSTFDADAVIDFNNPYLMLDWKQFRRYIMQTTNGGSNKNKYNRLVRLKLRPLYKETSDVINYEISDIWNKTRHYAIPDVKPDETPPDTPGIIDVNINMPDKDIREAENRE